MTSACAPADLWMDLDETQGVVYLGGQLDRRGCSHVGEAVLSCICRTPEIDVVDIRQVDLLSTSAIQLLDRVRHLVAAHGRTLRIVSRPGTPARAALAAVGLGPHLVAAPGRPPT